jgi:diguanylate cyclase (GGDEF)-like protein
MEMNALWTAGAAGQPARRARQITVTNQIALFAAASVIPYQAFYLAADAAYYRSVVGANFVFIGCYLAVLVLNRAAWFHSARNLLLGTVYVQLFVVTMLIGNGAGVDLFYFSLAAGLSVLFVRRQARIILPLIALASAMYLVCQFALPPERAWLVIPPRVQQIMFAGSAVGAMLIASAFAFLFRHEIDRAEQALVRANQELAELSSLDSLTGLANRRELDACLARECARAARAGETIALLLCDVDAFKAFNDTYGHPAGDACLQRVAEVLRTIGRRAGDLVARYGGEEFALVLPATDGDAAVALAEQAREATMALDKTHRRSPAAEVVTLSIGVACATGDEPPDPEALLLRADTALYGAKRAGRNRVVQWKEARAA